MGITRKIMIVFKLFLLAGSLAAAFYDELDTLSNQPRFNSSCGNLPEAEVCENDCITIYGECIGKCSDEACKSKCKRQAFECIEICPCHPGCPLGCDDCKHWSCTSPCDDTTIAVIYNYDGHLPLMFN